MKPDEDILKVFLEVEKQFPFEGYMSDKKAKYYRISSIIREAYSPGARVLSIGCGPCDLEAQLSKMGYSVVGIDDLRDHWHLIGKNIERIKEFANKMGIELVLGTADAPPHYEDHFDVVILIDVIEHLHGSPRNLLNYAISALRGNGLLLVETPNAASLINRLRTLFGKSSGVAADFIYWNIGEYRSHVREYTESELRRILGYHDLAEVSTEMVSVKIQQIRPQGLFLRACVAIYNLATLFYPNLKDTVLVSGRKPAQWTPTASSLTKFSRLYAQIDEYNLDNESVDDISRKLSKE